MLFACLLHSLLTNVGLRRRCDGAVVGGLGAAAFLCFGADGFVPAAAAGRPAQSRIRSKHKIKDRIADFFMNNPSIFVWRSCPSGKSRV